MIVGWVLVNNLIQNPVLQFSKDKVGYFKSQNLILNSATVGLALQICIDQEYQGLGVIQKAFSFFESMVSSKYDIIEASVKKDNPAGNAATTKLNMIQIFEDDLRVYKIKSTSRSETNPSKVFNINNKSLFFRNGKFGDETELFELNNKWLINNVSNISKGFLTSLYSPDEFRKIISCGDIVIAETR